MNNISAINGIYNLDSIQLYKILESNQLTNKQKAEFIKNNSSLVNDTLKQEITLTEFKELMKHRPLIRFRPIKNSFTKKGDKILLAKSLGIEQKEVNKYIESIIKNEFSLKDAQRTSDIDKVKTYVYRHGTKNQVASFLEHELSDVKTVLEKLYKTLEDNSGGLADYFSRPIHRMDNRTLRKLYNIIDKALRSSYDAGYIKKEELDSVSEWALVKIYQIQNNSKVIRAFELYKSIS